jgi:hypothetical protein
MKVQQKSVNDLLAIWLTGATALAGATWTFGGPFKVILAGYLMAAWPLMRHLNRRAWKHHFRPRADKQA